MNRISRMTALALVAVLMIAAGTGSSMATNCVGEWRACYASAQAEWDACDAQATSTWQEFGCYTEYSTLRGYCFAALNACTVRG